jgi:hypothetical protein
MRGQSSARPRLACLLLPGLFVQQWLCAARAAAEVAAAASGEDKEEAATCQSEDAVQQGEADEASIMSQEMLQVGLSRRKQGPVLVARAERRGGTKYVGYWTHPSFGPGRIPVECTLEDSTGTWVSMDHTETVTVERSGDAIKISDSSGHYKADGTSDEGEAGVVKGEVTWEGTAGGTFMLMPTTESLAEISQDPMTPGLDGSHLDASLNNKTFPTRGERLCAEDASELYHQTDMPACLNILNNGFDMQYATGGNLGLGTYFADDAAATGYKTRHWGCVIIVLVRLGKVYDMGPVWLAGEDRCSKTFGEKLNEMGYDSMTTTKHGRERAIFQIDQVLDMIAYRTCTQFGCHEPEGEWVGGRSELNHSACNPKDFPDAHPQTETGQPRLPADQPWSKEPTECPPKAHLGAELR